MAMAETMMEKAPRILQNTVQTEIVSTNGYNHTRPVFSPTPRPLVREMGVKSIFNTEHPSGDICCHTK